MPQTYTELKALYGKELAGEALYKKIQAEANKFIDDALAQIKLGCFVAETLVHTREGLRPIEEIKVGDYVLSKPENGEGELCYQPVTRTYEYENRELYYVIWSARKELPEGEKPPSPPNLPWSEDKEAWKEYFAKLRETSFVASEDIGCIAVTGGHPIWVERFEFFLSSTSTRETENIYRWMSVEDLYIRKRGNLDEESIDKSLDRVYAKLADGRAAVISTIHPILQSEDPDIGVAFDDCPGWEEDHECGGWTLCFGREGVRDHVIDSSIKPLTHLWQIDTSAYDYSGYDTESEMSVVRRSGGYLPMRRKVYNLEVANTHTYFVARLGLWVHNTSGTNIPLYPAENLGVFVGRAYLPDTGPLKTCLRLMNRSALYAFCVDSGSNCRLFIE